MSLLFADMWKLLNVQYYFDGDKTKIGKKYIDGYISDYVDGSILVSFDNSYKFLIPPTYKIEVSLKVYAFLRSLGIYESRIIRLELL